MEQLEQLAGIRDAAEKRLEEARAAIERSPDAKLVASLTLLIDDLKKSFEAESEAVPAEAAADASAEEAPIEEAAPQEAPAETGSAVQQEEEAPAETEDAKSEEEFSLEDSLEAELLSVDSGSSKS